ncbi:MAG: hypothetical protein H6Q89_1764 [Myxococcaceae bacterium]|nr:hypothetical protein [Myxococcaceae bacterium]
MLLFALLVAASAFFTCVGLWPTHRQRLLEGWAAQRLRQRFRANVQRARLRSMS